MRKSLFLLSLIATATIYAQFDLAFLPAFEHRTYQRITTDGTTVAHTYLTRTGDTVKIAYTNGNDSSAYGFTVTGKPLDYRHYLNGKLTETVIYDWNMKKIHFDGIVDGAQIKETHDLKDNTICAFMVSEVFRGYPWGKDNSKDFNIFSVEKGRKYFDAVLKVSRKDVAVPGTSYKANIVKLSAGFGFIKLEQKYDFYYSTTGTHALVYYDGVDGLDRKLTSTLKTNETR
ncbi:MAG: hypothetical protein HZC28_14990 [Spirochaetes bacterium]|nr:hypothetical protein [Spirochaetota bacterium]